MSRATLISRIVFGLLVIATFTAFFVAQRLKRSEPLVYAVQMKKYVSPNGDRVRARAYVRFRIKRADSVTVEVLNRAQVVVRTLAEHRNLDAGAHRFYWNGRERSRGRRVGRPVADGGYHVRISLARAGRTFVPNKLFVVDTVPPRPTVKVSGPHTVSALAGRPSSLPVEFTGVSPSRRVEFEVFAVRGQRTLSRPVAAFVNTRGKARGGWDLTVGRYRQRKTPCFGRLHTTGRARPAPPGSYVIVARACDAAGNTGFSSRRVPPRRGDAGAAAGVTLRGVEVAPGMLPLTAGSVAALAVNPPAGGYRYRLRRIGGGIVARGNGRGPVLHLRVPVVPSGLYVLTVTALRTPPGSRGSASAPVVVAPGRARGPLVVYPSFAWQGLNPVDVDGDGFADDYASLTDGRELQVRADRTLAGGRLPAGFGADEAALAGYLATLAKPFAGQATTDYALALDPRKSLAGRPSLLFAGDERWITPQLGLALKRFVQQGGRVAFFAPDAFRSTVRLAAGSISGPSPRAERDIFGESISVEQSAPAPLVAFGDRLGLLQGPTGLFTRFENSRLRARAAEELTAAGRHAGNPALVAYRLGKGMVIRVGAAGWQSRLVPARAVGATVPDNANVAFTTERILAELQK